MHASTHGLLTSRSDVAALHAVHPQRQCVPKVLRLYCKAETFRMFQDAHKDVTMSLPTFIKQMPEHSSQLKTVRGGSGWLGGQLGALEGRLTGGWGGGGLAGCTAARLAGGLE